MDTVALVKRDNDFYDVIIGGKKCGSGSWNLVDTAMYFYMKEGMKVKIYE